MIPEWLKIVILITIIFWLDFGIFLLGLYIHGRQLKKINEKG